MSHIDLEGWIGESMIKAHLTVEEVDLEVKE
jgi:hypothetical protein